MASEFDPSVAVFGRRTPEPARVRLAMAALVLLGGSVGYVGAMLPAWAGRLAMDLHDAGWGFLALGCGALAAALAARASGWTAGPRLRRLFALSALGCAAAWAAAPAAASAELLVVPLVLLGMAGGGLMAATGGALRGSLSRPGAEALVHLSGVAFGVGAVAVVLAAWAFLDPFGWPAVSRALAVAAAGAAWAVGRRAPLAEEEGDSSGERAAVRAAPGWSPAAALLALGLTIQACNYAIAGGWLALYIVRKFGATVPLSLGVLLIFWAALTSGRVAATRLPGIWSRMRSLAGASAVALLGSLFLLKTAELSGAAVGAALFGAGLGALHPLTMAAATRRTGAGSPGVVHGYFAATFLLGLFLAAAVGPLASRFGIEMVVWIPAAGSVAAWLVLTVIVVETKLGDAAAAAR